MVCKISDLYPIYVCRLDNFPTTPPSVALSDPLEDEVH